MEVKLFEVRDRATFLPVYGISTASNMEEQEYLLRRCGFHGDGAIIVSRLNGETDSSADAYHWGDRTMTTAHHYIEKNWHDLKNGDVIDVEFILGETDKPKVSEKRESVYDL